LPFDRYDRARADVIRLDGVGKTYRTRRGDVVRAVEDVTAGTSQRTSS